MTGRTVTREHLYDAVYGAAGLSRAEAAALVELVLEEIVSCLERGEAVKLSAFGSFIVRQKSPRMGRNPKTGKSAPIPPGRGDFQAVRSLETAHQPSILMEGLASPVSVAANSLRRRAPAPSATESGRLRR
jgi:integration host factor subunit alpha